MVRVTCPLPSDELTDISPLFWEKSYRVVPSSASAGSTSTGSSSSSHPQFSGVHDSLRAGGPRSLSAELSAPQHPLQNRLAEVRTTTRPVAWVRSKFSSWLTRLLGGFTLAQWDDTRDSLKFNVQRTAFGMHMPIRQAMERQLVSFVSVQSGPETGSGWHLTFLLYCTGPYISRLGPIQQRASRHSSRQRRKPRRERRVGVRPRRSCWQWSPQRGIPHRHGEEAPHLMSHVQQLQLQNLLAF